MNEKEIRSIAEFERRYFPGKAEGREHQERMKDPKRFGKWLAEQTLAKLRALREEILEPCEWCGAIHNPAICPEHR